MYLIREVMHCEPGKVSEMVEKFKGLSDAAQSLGYEGFRIYTDVSGRFWTVVLESEVESLDEFRKMEKAVMSDEDAQSAMAGYHALVQEGHREIYTVEN